MELDEVADELYGLRPQEFTAARDERARRARADGQRELAADIRSLRRPTAAAWASNLLVREQGEQVAPLLRLGEELRGAHRRLDGRELRTLSHRQHQLVDALAGKAAALASDAGSPLGQQARQEVAQTLHAVLADPDAAREWTAGRLSKPLAAAPGFEAAAREAASAPERPARSAKGTASRSRKPQTGTSQDGQPTREKTRTKQRKSRQEREQDRRDQRARQQEAEAARAAREAADQAGQRRREADEAWEEASAETARLRAVREEAEERVERLRTELREADGQRKECRKREREAERAERTARRRADAAAEAEERAREAVPAR